MLQRHHRRRGW